MFSYHRVLKLFGRSVTDKTIECDCDIHPWEIEIDGQQWPGKIRLIGFVDVFFVISYSANTRFEKGIIIYTQEDRVAFEELTEDLKDHKPKKNANSQALEETALDDSDTEQDKPRFTHKGRYVVQSLGHELRLSNEYPLEEVRPYEIKISKPHDWATRRRIKRGIRPHSLPDLMEDVVRCGFLTHAELMSQILGLVSAGGTVNDTATRYFSRLTAANAGQQSLSNDRA